jgi:hypothetical protein
MLLYIAMITLILLYGAVLGLKAHGLNKCTTNMNDTTISFAAFLCHDTIYIEGSDNANSQPKQVVEMTRATYVAFQKQLTCQKNQCAYSSSIFYQDNTTLRVDMLGGIFVGCLLNGQLHVTCLELLYLNVPEVMVLF